VYQKQTSIFSTEKAYQTQPAIISLSILTKTFYFPSEQRRQTWPAVLLLSVSAKPQQTFFLA
jgi:hypothetical protein